MELAPYVDELQRQLASAASAGAEESRELAERLATALDAAARLVLLEALSTAAGEITTELAPGSVEVRLRGRDPEFVVTPAAGTVPDAESDVAADAASNAAVAMARPGATDADEGGTTRTTLRLPDDLKSRAEAAAVRDGVSVNTWLVRAVAAALEPAKSKRTGRAETRSDRVTGWVR